MIEEKTISMTSCVEKEDSITKTHHKEKGFTSEGEEVVEKRRVYDCY
jgi:hypothetical protein